MITPVFASRARLASLSPTSRASSVAASASFLRGVFCSSVPFSRPRGILSSLSSKESGTSVGAHLFPSPQRVWSVALARSFSTDSGSQGERDTHAVAVKGWKDKPVSQWTKQDVGEWLQTQTDFEPLLPILKNLSGRDLVQLTKEELNELLRTLGSGTLTPQHASLGLAFFNTIQDLKRPPVDPESHLIPEATPKYRSLEKWNWLREFPELVLLDAETREKQIAEKWCNRFYPIPRLGDDIPKGMELQKFELLLTRQRIELALEFCRSLRLGVEQSFSSDPPPAKGYILSGPNGVGKTAISYLLACIAWANDAILVYSPLTSKWTHGDTVTQARYLMRRFLFFNASKAATIKATRGKSLFDVVHEGTEDHELTLTAYNTMLEVLSTIDHPVVYIVDEHNEIYREPEKKLHKSDVFKPFDRCTDYTVGKRIFTVLSGSAHSRFERALQPAMEDWVRRVRPLDEQSFRVMLAWYREKNGKPKADDAETKLIFQVTGGIPRELFFFEKSTESLEDWTKDRQNALADQLDTFVTEKLKNRTKLFMSFLQRMVSSALPSSGNRARPPGRYVDLGIIGFDGSVWRPTCLPARRALEMYYFTEGADGSSNAWLSECRTGTEMGLAFQRRVRDALTFGLHFSEDAGLFRIADAKKPEQGRRKLVISLPPAWQYDRLESPKTEAFDQSPCLYIPETQNHPAWDFVFYDPKNARVVFIQTSISQFRQGKQGYDHKFVKSFQSNAGANGVQSILERITRGEAMVSISEDGTFDVRITRDKAKVSIEILWLFVTTTPRDRLLQAERNLKDPRGNAACPDVIVIPKEACLEAKIVLEDDFNPPSAKARGAKRKGKKASTDSVSQNRLPERK